MLYKKEKIERTQPALPPEVVGKVFAHLGIINMKPILSYKSTHNILESNPEAWNSFFNFSMGINNTRFTNFLRFKEECIRILKRNNRLMKAIKRKAETKHTFNTSQADMTHLAIINDCIYVSSDDQSLRSFDYDGNLIKKFIGHSGGIWTFDQCKDKIVTGSTDKMAKIWNPTTESLIRTLKYHRSTIRVLQCYNDFIITGSRDHTIGIWNSIGDLLYRLEGHQQSVRCLDVSEEYLVSGSYDGTCKLWDYKKGKFIRNVHIHEKRVYCVKLYNGYVASSGLDTDVKISKVDGSAYTAYRLGNSIVAWIEFQDNFVVCASLDGTIVKYNYVHQKVEFTIQETATVKCQKIFNNLIIVGTSKEVKIYSFNSGKLIRILMDSYMISKIEATGNKIIVGHINNNEYKITVFDYESYVST